MAFMKPFLPLDQGESLISWLNRFGMFHSGLSLEEFLKLIEVPRQDLIMGRQTILERLSAITGVPMCDLKAGAYEYVSHRMFKYQGEVFFREFLLRSQVTFCPACLLSDVEDRRNGMPVGMGRLKWAFSPVRTCELHNMPLYRDHRPEGGGVYLNVSSQAPDQKGLEKLLQTAGSRKPSGLQDYVETRFASGGGTTWLDLQQIDLASRATEMLGACIEYGAHFPHLKLTENEWDRAGRVGFEFTSKGEKGIREGLEYICNRPQKKAPQLGPQGTFGKLYQWVQFRKTDKPVGPIKDVLREYILDTFPVQAGTMLFGQVIEGPRRHSVASLSTSFGVHAKTVTHALSKSGLLPLDDKVNDAVRTVPAGPAEELIGKLKRAIPVAKIPAYIGCTRAQASLLLEVGILSPVIADTDNACGRHKGVDARDLDKFVARLRQAGRSVDAPSSGMADVGQAAKVLSVSSMDIVSLLLKGRIDDVELLSADLKFRSVLVSIQEVALKLGAQTGKEGVTMSAVARDLGVARDAVRFLLQSNDSQGTPALKSCGQVRHMGVMRDLVDQNSLDHFKAHYRKLSMVEGFWPGDPDRVRSELASRGIRPVWDPTVAGAEFYKVADL